MLSDLMLVGGVLLAIVVLGTGGAWAAGMFNPCGYLGVPPWRVPVCNCSHGKGAFMHELACEITERRPR
jgi:hypothetical protein